MKPAVIEKKATESLAIPDQFRETALGFPKKVDAALALIETPEGAKALLDQASVYEVYARRIKADTEITNAITHGKTKIVAKLGALMKAKTRKETGRGKKKTSTLGVQDFHRNTAAKFRIVAAHADEIDDYFKNPPVDEFGQPEERSMAGFVKTVQQEAKEVKKVRAKAKRAAAAHASVSDGQFVTELSKLVGSKFGCIYADPPWQYQNQGTRASTDNHYSTMTVDEICALPIKDLAAEQAHLHLWTTNAFLFECPRIFDAWGFEFKSSFVWVKPQIGIGNYWRNSHEILLLAVRGGLVGQDKSLMSWVQCGRGAHSAKPDVIRGMVERLSPAPRLELFGRRKVPGWTVFGNEILDMI